MFSSEYPFRIINKIASVLNYIIRLNGKLSLAIIFIFVKLVREFSIEVCIRKLIVRFECLATTTASNYSQSKQSNKLHLSVKIEKFGNF